MKLSQGIEALELKANMGLRQSVVYPTLIWDDETAVLVDTGFPGMLPAIREAMGNAGVPFERLDKVILTHQDIDHIGSLPDVVKASAGRVEVISHENEKPYIQGEKRLLKMEPAHMQRMVANMPEAARRQFEALLQNPPKAAVGRTVADGEELPFCGGITVVFTPGHTYGHISLYHRPSRVLIAGDALVILEGKLCGPRPQNAADIGQAVKSLEKFAGFDIATVVCYHGGVCSENVSARIAELAKGE